MIRPGYAVHHRKLRLFGMTCTEGLCSRAAGNSAQFSVLAFGGRYAWGIFPILESLEDSVPNRVSRRGALVKQHLGLSKVFLCLCLRPA
jgi:hypothetical protein